MMIPAYKCAKFLLDTLESLLHHGISEEKMQIEVMDDASADADVAQLVTEVGEGRIKYFRQSKNVGSLVNFDTCINRSKARLNNLLQGDDRIKTDYNDNIERLFEQHLNAGAVCSIDEEGKNKSLMLAEYSRHSNSITRTRFLAGEHLLYIYRAMMLI